jgi:hypothetical protein
MTDRDAYRDDLAAAQARVATLEDALAARNASGGEARAREIAELEARRAKALAAGDERRIRKATLLLVAGIFVLLLTLLAVPAFLVSGDLPSLGLLAIAAVPCLLLGGILPLVFKAGAKQELANVDARLGEATRMRELEEQVKETRGLLAQMAQHGPRVRLDEHADAGEPTEDREPEEDEAPARRRSRS